MTIEIDPSELGAYTNNLPNKEGIKKLLKKIEEGGGSSDAYTKAETDALLDEKQNVLTAGTGITIENDTISVLLKDWDIVKDLDEYKSVIDTPTSGLGIMAKEDLIFYFNSDGDGRRNTLWFVPKGYNIPELCYNFMTTDSISIRKLVINKTNSIVNINMLNINAPRMVSLISDTYYALNICEYQTVSTNIKFTSVYEAGLYVLRRK